MFVNVTHPSQIRDKKVQRRVKAFTSTHNQRRRRVDRGQQLPDNSTPYLSPPQSTDEDSESVNSTAGPGSSTKRHYKTQDLTQRIFEADESDVEELKRVPKSTNEDLSRPEFNHGEILDLYPAVGNITLPYSEAILSRQTAARLRRLTQYYIEVDGPMSIWRPQQLVQSSQVATFKRNFFALSMAEPIVIETIFAGSQLRLDLRSDPSSKPSAIVLQHRGKVLKMIQERLKRPDTMLDDVTFFAIVGMITLDAFCRNWTSFKSNLDGFLSLASLRGGTEKLGWQGWFQTHIAWAELRWATYMVQNQLHMTIPANYPRHPFPPALTLIVSKLPTGFREAALKLDLSVEVLNLLHAVAKWTSSSYDEEKRGQYYLDGLKLTARNAHLMGKYELSASERILCVGTLAYIIETDGRAKESRIPRGLEDYLVGIDTLYAGVQRTDYLFWAAVVIAASNDNPQAKSTNKLLVLDSMIKSDADDGEFRENWANVRKRLRNYFWNETIEKEWEKCWERAVERNRTSEHIGTKLAERQVPKP